MQTVREGRGLNAVNEKWGIRYCCADGVTTYQYGGGVRFALPHHKRRLENG